MDYRTVDPAIKKVGVLGTTILVMFAVGCEFNRSTPLADTGRNIAPEHGHQHGPGHDHNHHHADGHSHEHRHRHDDAPRGGKIISIGHSHHADEVTSFHAEVMPVVAGQISFQLLTDNSETRWQPLEIEESEVPAYVNRHDDPSPRAHEIVFLPSADQPGRSSFSAGIPDSLSDSRRFTVVVPKVTIGGKRTSFSFDAERSGPREDAGAPAKAATEVAP